VKLPTIPIQAIWVADPTDATVVQVPVQVALPDASTDTLLPAVSLIFRPAGTCALAGIAETARPRSDIANVNLADGVLIISSGSKSPVFHALAANRRFRAIMTRASKPAPSRNTEAGSGTAVNVIELL
jgi:hypothetical protein